MMIQIVGCLCLLIAAFFTWSFISSFRATKDRRMGERDWAEFTFEAISIWLWLSLGLFLMTF